MIQAISYAATFILTYFTLLWVGYLFLLLATILSVLRKFKETSDNKIIDSLNANPLLPITIIIPMYNEYKRVLNAVTAIFASDYKNIHLIIVDDGSTDQTVNLLIETYDMIPISPAFQVKNITGKVDSYYMAKHIPHFILIKKAHSPFENSGADCINAGLNVCRTPLYLTVDADTILEKEALTRMLYTYLITPHCVAVGGAIYVPDTIQIEHGQVFKTNIPKNVILGVQVCEYLRSFIYGREGWRLMGGALCYPGAFTLFETKAVLDAGGYDAANFSYDAEIVMKLHHVMRKRKFPYNVAFSSSSISWSEEPRTLKALWRQRSNWQRGLLRSLSLHKGMFFNPRYGKIGLLAFPYFIFFEIFGPVVEAFAYITFLFAMIFTPGVLLNLGWFILLAWSYMLLITMSCTVLSVVTYNKYYTKWDVLHIFGLTWLDMVFCRQWRAFCALWSSIYYIVNRLRGRSE